MSIAVGTSRRHWPKLNRDVIVESVQHHTQSKEGHIRGGASLGPFAVLHLHDLRAPTPLPQVSPDA